MDSGHEAAVAKFEEELADLNNEALGEWKRYEKVCPPCPSPSRKSQQNTMY
jgi:hypothetical protein